MQELKYNHQRGNIPVSMSKLPLFAQLKEECLEELLEHASVVQLKAGDALICEGGRSAGLFILLNGSVEISRNGRPFASMSKVGDLIGEMGFILNKPHQATVTAAGNAAVFKIDGTVMKALSDENLDHFQGVIYRYLTQLLAERLIETSERLTKADQAEVYYL